jgi:hypothetical protein
MANLTDADLEAITKMLPLPSLTRGRDHAE